MGASSETFYLSLRLETNSITCGSGVDQVDRSILFHYDGLNPKLAI